MGNKVSRNKEHELIMISIYDALLYTSNDEEFSLEDVMEAIYGESFEEIPHFSKKVVVKSLSHLNEIKEIYQVQMPKWKFDRLNAIERAILLMSYTNFKLVGGVDKGVVIDRAVRLAKTYLDKDDYKFVNAILDNVL